MKTFFTFILFLVLTGCSASQNSANAGGTVAPAPQNPMVSSNDQLPIQQNQDGTFSRQALSFFPAQAIDSSAPSTDYVGTSN